MPKLSIITCTYNSELYLQQCIDSVISQKLDKNEYEHIFVDWFSTDKTHDIIKKYIKENSTHAITFVQKPAKWIYNAMNEGIKIAQWEYVICLNSDDYLAKQSLVKYLEFIDITWQKDFYFAKVQFFSKENPHIMTLPHYTFLRRIAFYKFWFNSLVCHPGVLLKKKIFERFWYFNENFKIMSDFALRTKLYKSWIHFIFFDHIVSHFRMHEGSATWTSQTHNRDVWFREYKMVRQQYYWKFFGWLMYVISRYTSQISLFFLSLKMK